MFATAIVASITGTLALPAPGTALSAVQTPDPAPDSIIEVSELVVTATRVRVSRDAVTSGFAVVTGEQLRDLGFPSLADALRAIPGATLVRTGPVGAVTSMFLRGGNSGYVRVLIDGVPVNEPGGAIDLAGLTTEGVERVEVVRGGTSVLYGSDAVTGVIQIFTRRGGGATRVHASAGAGSHGTISASAGGRGSIGSATWSLTASHEATDGTLTTDGVHDLDNSFRNNAANGALGISPDARTDVRLSLLWNDGTYRFPTDGTGQLVRAGSQNRERLAVGVEAGRRIGDRLEVRLGIAHYGLHSEIDDRPAAFSDADDRWLSVRDVARQAAELLANYQLAGSSTVTLGASIERQREEATGLSESSFGTFGDTLDARRTNRAYFAQVLSRPAARLDFQGGVRLEDNEAFGTFVTYRAGLAARVASSTRLRGSVGTSFKEPTFIENFSQGFSVGNPDLDPERSLGWEIGVEQRLGDGRVELSGAWFDQRFRDLIQYHSSANPGDPNYSNVAGARANGLEFELRADAGAGVSIDADYTWLETRVTEPGHADPSTSGAGTRLLRRPEHKASVALAYRLAGGATGTVTLQYVGERDDLKFENFIADRVTLDPYTRVDAAVNVPVMGGAGAMPPVIATLRLNNAFGTEYEEAFGFPAPGRQFFLGVRIGRE
ncbi:MAG TPA: TonB-dependent receptor [Longimicrobiales bacterium]|nr:TonB-dependent receptor [Longimicrobiales bacterium]